MMRLRCHTLLYAVLLFDLLLIADALQAQSRPTISDPLRVWASSRIASEIDDGALRLLSGNHHPLARREFDAGAVAADLPMQRMVLVLHPSQAQVDALDALLEAQQDSASPHFHQWLTPAQFAEHFGASSLDTQRIVGWLESHGMRIDEVAPSRTTITFSGTASKVERTFATRLRHYRVNGINHVANETDPSIPRALAPVVSGVLSLHDFPVHAMLSSIGALRPRISYGSAHFLTPLDLATIYNVTPLYGQGLDGRGQSVAVVARSNINLGDVQTFRSNYGLPANDPLVIVNGTDPGTSNITELLEATLDAEYAGSLAQNATVKFVTSSSTSASDGTYLSAQYIVNQDLASVMTMSFGLCEQDLGTSGNTFISNLWEQAAAQGITVLVAAGDSGVAGCDSASSSQAQRGRGVNGLCSTPYNTCVGGTQFDDIDNPSQYWSANNDSATNASALGYIPEQIWNESASKLWAGGGGSSTLYSKPAWQIGKGVPADGLRDVPDVSLAAAGHDGYLVLVNGLQYVVAGTSAASPALASIFTLVGQSAGTRLGLANINLYALANQQSSAAAFHDVTVGNNSVPGLAGYSAADGYDLASGLGSVDANALVTHWRDTQASPSIQVTLSTSSLTVAASSSSPITVKVAGFGGFSSTVTLTASGLPSGVTAKFSPSSIVAPGSGLLQLEIASTMAVGSYTFNIVAASGTLSSSARANITVVAPTTTSLSSTNSAIFGTPVTFIATVTPSASTGNSPTTQSITGTVTFKVGSTTIGTTSVSGGAATLDHVTVSTANGYSIGPDSITAIYSGDTNYGTSTGAETLTVTAPTYTMTASSTAVSITAGGNVTVNLTLISANYAGTVLMAASSNSLAVPANAPSVTLTNNGTGSSTLTISTTASAASHPPLRPWKNGAAAVLCAMLLSTPLTLPRKRAWAVLLAVTAILLAGFLMACGGGGGGSTKPTQRTYTVTVVPAGSGTVTNPPVVTITVTVL